MSDTATAVDLERRIARVESDLRAAVASDMPLIVIKAPPGSGKTHCETASTVPTGAGVRIGPAGRSMTRKTHWLA